MKGRTRDSNRVSNRTNDKFKNAANTIVASIKTATTSRTETIIGDATSYITSHTDNLLHKMETVFAENMQLVEDVTDEYDIEASVRTTIEINMDTSVTSRLLEDITNSSQVHDTSENIIIALEKRQQAMELTFISKMDRDLKQKSAEADKLIANVIATIDGRLEKCKKECNLQIYAMQNKQQTLIDDNKRLYKDVKSMKSVIQYLET